MGKTGDSAYLIESFLDMMSAERGASANTLAAYRRDLLDFGASLVSSGRVFGDAAPADLKRYIASLSGMASATQSRRLSTLRQFFTFLYSEGIRQDDPTGTLQSPRRERPLPKVLSRSDIESLIATACEKQDAESLRLTCFLEILYAS